jgi:hypothetical protein
LNCSIKLNDDSLRGAQTFSEIPQIIFHAAKTKNVFDKAITASKCLLSAKKFVKK